MRRPPSARSCAFSTAHFTLDTVRRIDVSLKVEGEDGFELEGRSSMAEIARDPADLVKQLMGRHHQYPDGAVLFLGTMFSPVKDRGAKGQGFTHKVGDVTTIARAGAGYARQSHDALHPGSAMGSSVPAP